jgi:hypothetical protein
MTAAREQGLLGDSRLLNATSVSASAATATTWYEATALQSTRTLLVQAVGRPAPGRLLRQCCHKRKTLCGCDGQRSPKPATRGRGPSDRKKLKPVHVVEAGDTDVIGVEERELVTCARESEGGKRVFNSSQIA